MVNNEKPKSNIKPIVSRQEFRDQAVAIHSTRLTQIGREMLELSGTATRLAQACAEAALKGTTLDAQKQIAFLWGAMARIQKDWGAVELLQSQGIVSKIQKPKSPL